MRAGTVYVPPLSPARPGSPPRRFTASLALALGPIGAAPSRVRLWSPGINPWDGEPQINLTRAAAERVIAAFSARGANPLSMDFEHAISLAEAAQRRAPNATPVEPEPLAGYCMLELVETPEGPAIDFLPRWSDCGRDAPVPEVICCAKHQIESGQRAEFSPDWVGDETTGEPIRVNRISLVGDGAMHGIGLLASRASAAQARGTMDEMKECRAAYAYHARMAAAGGDDAKEHEGMAARLKASAAALGVDVEKAPEGDEKKPEEPKPAETASRAAELPAPESPKPAVAAAALASRATAATLTLDQVLQKVDERNAERSALQQLLDLNKDRIPEGHRAMLASQGLAAAKTYVAGLPAKPAPAGTGGDAGGPVPHAPGAQRAHRRPLNAGEQFLANRVRAALGKTDAEAEAFDKRPEVSVDDQGRAGYEFSLVEIIAKKATERQNRRAA
jgi:hypothetical protein